MANKTVCALGLYLAALGTTRVLVAQSATVAERSTEAPRATTVSLDAINEPIQRVVNVVAQQAGLSAVYGAAVASSPVRVTLHLRDVPVARAFEQVLRGTGMSAVIGSGRVVVMTGDDSASRATQTGSVSGMVTDARTKTPLRGVAVSIDGKQGATTDANGAFRIGDVADGEHRVTVRMLGYVKQVKVVVVAQGQTASVNVALDASVSALDQVVVTGTVVATELKAVPNAITVISAKQIEERGITRIDQLFRGDVPGIFSPSSGSGNPMGQTSMFVRGATSLGSTSRNTNPIKTYVDGVEMVDPSYLSTIDPRSIERIEILTGPQASTIYGSNALNGVMQIFTKRGTTTQPQLALNLLSGVVQNNYSSARTPQHDLSAQLSGVDGRVSYNGGGSWNYIGQWTPAMQQARSAAFGGIKLSIPTTFGAISTDVTYRRTVTLNHTRADAAQDWTNLSDIGWYQATGSRGISTPMDYGATGQSIGLTATYAPTTWWSHELSVGQDGLEARLRTTGASFISPDDTASIFVSRDHNDRRSVHYTTTARVPLASIAQAVVTLGADEWQQLEVQTAGSSATNLKKNSTNFFYREWPAHNAGGFVQARLDFRDQLFFTYGLRAEWNPTFGDEVQPNLAPRYGVTFTQEVGAVTTKVRASYGRATRPPASYAKLGVMQSATSGSIVGEILKAFGDYESTKANPFLQPERQKGLESGLEMYLGNRVSFGITRYNQTVDALIANVLVDSVRSLTPNPLLFGIPCTTENKWFCSSVDTDGYGYMPQHQYINVARLRNQGWELQGSLMTGPITTRGVYSWTKSRSLGVAPRYQALFSPLSDPQMQKGASFQYMPEHTWSLGVTYAQSGNSIALNITGVGQVFVPVDETAALHLSWRLRLDQNVYSYSGNAYVQGNRGYAMADLNASHRFSRRIDGVFQITNLTNTYKTDDYWGYASIGRQAQAGFRIRM